ncbi:hypothetical protein H257_14548 [Aphanomyces astaci]|uniref:FAR1 domain-containing protein n=1 Tax=Aphanomyces astaci TaxID=112090 RepID=W4FQD3_APHAT|nr:hypothetical protein H257_14548 [Aphanomyces astaci]ETV69685.1 hypothetical protein H257_14548 [Aphanomyces astaci]|eukprot:XP_009840699.1 hypothetical protein H257_14548 [Aphanomyces astaci]
MSSEHTLDDQDGVDEATRPNATTESTVSTFGDLLVMHHNFIDANEFITSVPAWARAQGFTVSRTGKNFCDKTHHPVHGGRGSIMWCSTLYFTHKKEMYSGRSTCQWRIKFSFDKANLNYSITSIG